MKDEMKAKCYRLDYNELGLSTLCVEKDKEIERLKDDNKYLNKVNIELSSEKNRLNSIIKEVREYIEKNTQWYDKELGLVEVEGYNSNRIPVVYLYGLLEILDKVGSVKE